MTYHELLHFFSRKLQAKINICNVVTISIKSNYYVAAWPQNRSNMCPWFIQINMVFLQ